MKRMGIGSFVLAGTLAAAGLAAADDSPKITPDAVVVPPGTLSCDIAVRDVRVADGTVSGAAVNTSSNPLRDVTLLLRYAWLWNAERRPGKDAPGRVAYVTVPGELRPAESKEFTYRPDPPLAARRDGHFAPRVEVAEVVQLAPGTEAGHPTAGRR